MSVAKLAKVFGLYLTCVMLIALTASCTTPQPAPTVPPPTAALPPATQAVSPTAALAPANAVPTGAAAGKPLTIAILTNSPIASSGWSYQLNQAGIQFQQVWGDKVKIVVAPNIAYGEPSARTIEQLISDGANVIIEGVYSMETTDKLILAHPDVKFIVFRDHDESP